MFSIEEVQPYLAYSRTGELPKYILIHGDYQEINVTVRGLIDIGERFIKIGNDLRIPALEGEE